MTQFLVLSVALGFDRYFLLFESPSGKAWALITKVNDATRRWSDRSSDSISMLIVRLLGDLCHRGIQRPLTQVRPNR
jgi:hypothetical protein